MIFEKSQSASKEELITFLDLLLLSGFQGLSRELELNLQLKFSKNLDGFSLENFFKICLVLGEYTHVGEEFWQLAQFILEDKLWEFEAFLNGESSISLDRKYPFLEKLQEHHIEFELYEDISQAMNLVLYIQDSLEGKLDLSAFIQLAERSNLNLNRFGLELDHGFDTNKGEIVSLEEEAASEL